MILTKGYILDPYLPFRPSGNLGALLSGVSRLPGLTRL